MFSSEIMVFLYYYLFFKLSSKLLARERLLRNYLVDLFLKHLTTNTPIPSFMTLVSRHCSSFNRILYFRHLFLDCDWLNFHMNEKIIVLSIEEPGRNYSRSDLLPLIEWTFYRQASVGKYVPHGQPDVLNLVASMITEVQVQIKVQMFPRCF